MAEFDPDAYLKKKPKEAPAAFDPDAYLKSTQPETATQTVGRFSASTIDSALNALTGTLDLGPRAAARAYYGGVQGMRGDALEQKITQETTSPKDVVGRAFGVTGTPGYENAPLRALGREIAPVIQENVINPLASATGQSPEYVSDVIGIGSFAAAPVVPKVARGTVQAAKTTGRAVAAVPDVVRGASGTITGKIAAPGAVPEPWQVPSARQPVGKEYIPAPELEAWRKGDLSTPDVTAAVKPTAELPQGALQRTQGMIPFKGQGARAFGEQLGEVYKNPLNLLTDIGLDVLTGTPLPTAARIGYKGYQAARKASAVNELGKLGFTPMFPEELAALRAGQPHPSVIIEPGQPGFDFRTASQAVQNGVVNAPDLTPVAPPRLTYNPTPETIYVAPEGVASTDIRAANRAGIEQKYPPVTVGPVAPESLPTAPVTTAAAETPRPVAPVAPAGESMTGQKLSVDEILARVQDKKRGVFETAEKAPTAPVDLAANRTAFTDKINQHRAGMEETRAQNKETYSGTAENLGRGTEAERLERMSPAERAEYYTRQAARTDAITDAAVVKDMINTTTNTGIRRYKNNNIVNESVFDEFAVDAGVVLDWKTAPDISKMGFAEGRTAMNDWMYKQIKTDANDLGLDTRTGGMRGQVKAMEEANKNIQGLNDEEAASAVKAAQERMAKMRKRGSMEMMSDESAGKFASKQDFKEQQSLDTLSGKFTEGEFTEGNTRTVHYTVKAGPFVKYMSQQYDVKTGKKIGNSKLIDMKKVK